MNHFAKLCGCGMVLETCRCPAINKKLTVSDTCEHNDNWAQKLEIELSEQFDIPANTNIRPYGQTVQVELNGVRQVLDVMRSSLYGFVLTLRMYDETGGPIVESEICIGLHKDQLATTIDSIYRSYQ